MRQAVFQRLKDIEKEEDMDDLEVGEYFLYGRNVIAQKQVKQPGQAISYYEVIEKTESGSVIYTPVFDTLEKDYNKED